MMVRMILNVMLTLHAVFNPRIHCYLEDQTSCGIAVKSDCNDNITTKWNTQHIKKNLKNWIQSISKIDLLSSEDIERINIKKTLLIFDEKDIITNKTIGRGMQFIGNIDCSNLKHVGPTRRKPSLFSKRQFHDGFLYGVEDGHGEITGSFAKPILIHINLFKHCKQYHHSKRAKLFDFRRFYHICISRYVNCSCWKIQKRQNARSKRVENYSRTVSQGNQRNPDCYA